MYVGYKVSEQTYRRTEKLSDLLKKNDRRFQKHNVLIIYQIFKSQLKIYQEQWKGRMMEKNKVNNQEGKFQNSQ